MYLEILGYKAAKIEGMVKVVYKTGKVALYDAKEIKRLIINPDEVVEITVN